jgi:hypothetical protein
MKVKTTQTALATDYRAPGSLERLVGANGEINASSKKDAFRQQQVLLQATAQGAIMTLSQAERQERTAKNIKVVQAMFNSPRVHQELGEVMAADLYQAANRRGFSRKFLARQDLVPGQFPTVKMRLKDVVATYATAPVKTESQIIRDKLFMPPEIILEARPFVELRELNTSSSDVLDEKYSEALEAIMVGEDRLWISAANQTVGLDNDLTVISGTLSPLTLMEVRTNVARWDLPVPQMLMASDLYNDIVGDATFIQAIEPVARHELIMTGELAVLYGMAITSDAYRHPEHRVLTQGEFYAISDPVTHGQYTDRGGIETEVLNGSTEKIAGKGWWMYESYSLVIANSRSVAKGVRR